MKVLSHLLVCSRQKHNYKTKVWSHCLCCPVVTIFLVHGCFKMGDESKTNALAAFFLVLESLFQLGMGGGGPRDWRLSGVWPRTAVEKKMGAGSGLKMGPHHCSKEQQLFSARWTSCCTRPVPTLTVQTMKPGCPRKHILS